MYTNTNIIHTRVCHLCVCMCVCVYFAGFMDPLKLFLHARRGAPLSKEGESIFLELDQGDHTHWQKNIAVQPEVRFLPSSLRMFCCS